MNESNKNLESFLKKSYEGFDQEPSDMVWKGLEERMDEDKDNRRRPFWWIWLRNSLGVLAIIGISALAYYFTTKNSNESVASSEASSIETKTSTNFDTKDIEENETHLITDRSNSKTLDNTVTSNNQKQKKNVQTVPTKTKDSSHSDKLSSSRAYASPQKKAFKENKKSYQNRPALKKYGRSVATRILVDEKESDEPSVSSNIKSNKRLSSGPPLLTNTPAYSLPNRVPETPVKKNPVKVQYVTKQIDTKTESDSENNPIETSSPSKAKTPEKTKAKKDQNILDKTKTPAESASPPDGSTQEESEEESKPKVTIDLRAEKDDEKEAIWKQLMPSDSKNSDEEIISNKPDDQKDESNSDLDGKIEKVNRVAYKAGPSIRMANTITELANHVEAGISLGLHQEFIRNRWAIVNKTHINANGYALDREADADGLSNETLSKYPHFFTEDNQVKSVAATSYFFDNSLGLSYSFVQRERINVSFTPSMVWQLYLPQTFHYDFENEEVLSLRSNVYLVSLGSVQASVDFKYIFKSRRHMHMSLWAEKSLIPLGLDDRNTFLKGLQLSYMFGKK